MRGIINRPPLMGRILKLVPQKQPRQNHLDLISRKKSPWASIFAMAEVQVILGRGRELMAVGLFGTF